MSCVCITRNRRAWLPTAINCFLQQTYRPIELVLLNDEDADRIGDLVAPMLNCFGRGQHITYHALRPMSVGAKRNVGCELSRGEFVCHWDDDDWSAPERVETQVRAIQSCPTAVISGLRNMLFTDGTDDGFWVYEGTPGFMLGTSLMYRRDWWKEGHRFEDRRTCEDSRLVDTTSRDQRAILEGTTSLMYATVHGQNTSPRTINTYSWKKVEKPKWVKEVHPGFSERKVSQ